MPKLWMLFFTFAAVAAGAQAPERVPVELPNAGFEQGAQGWDLPANAAVVSDQASCGTRSARLVVQDPAAENVYIARQVPVTGGASYAVRCKVRTAGVTQKPGRMESVGAGLIVEWADKQGRWFGSGEYATGLFGDQAWTTREALGLRAPEEAGFAVIYLALRGAGTAWFDDIELSRLTRRLSPQSPASGAELRDNTPTLQWRDDVQAMGFTVELSVDPAFPPGATTRHEAAEPHLTVRLPLRHGRWYWRVSAPGYDPSEARSFEQTAPAGQDTSAPEVLSQSVRVTRDDQTIQVRIREAGRQPAVAAVLNGAPVTARLRRARAGGYEAVLSTRWRPGLNRVTLTATDRAGNAESREVVVLFRPVPGRPVTIAPDGAYLEGGKRVFPLGIYQVRPQAMARVKQAGFGVVHVYTFESSTDDEAAAAYLDAAQAAGLRVFIGFDRGRSSGQGLMQGNAGHVIERVAALCHHPALFCWYLFDEPEVADQYISARALNAYADLIRRLDPYHPVVVTTWGNRMALYRPSFDTHWTQSYSPPARVVTQIEEHRAQLGPKTPITLLVHCYDQPQTERLRKGKAVDPARFQPDVDWLRAAAFAGVTQRVNGLWWWWYAEEVKDFVTIASVPEVWQGLAGVLAQIRELEPVLVHPAKAATGKLGAVHWWRKTVGGETTLIAVNTSEQPATVRIPAPGSGSARVLLEGRDLARQAGGITDSFGRYGVHVYRFGR